MNTKPLSEVQLKQQKLIEEMLSGRPFTYPMMMTWRGIHIGDQDTDKDRLVDRTIQKLRKEGKIACTRSKQLVLWRPTGA